MSVDDTISYLINDNETDEAKAWNLAQCAICTHNDLNNDINFALADLQKRFPEFIFLAISSTSGPMVVGDITMEKRGG